MNKLSEKGSFISKSEAVMLQAVAVMLMVGIICLPFLSGSRCPMY